jgi:hypothetical protein
MAITGGAKFFDTIKNLSKDGATVVASSGDATSDRILDRNKVSIWKSVGTDDTTTETITITLPSATSITRLFLIGHNWKQYTVKHDSATDFTNVVGLDGALGGGIAETAFTDTTSYYEFTSASVTDLEITVTKTHVVDDEKYLNMVIVTTELGTLNGFPEIRTTMNRGKKTTKMLSGRMNVLDTLDTLDYEIKFRNYPTSSADSYPDDVALMFTLNERNDTFLFWPCGGRRGTTYFRHTLRGFRLEDVANVKIINELKPKYQTGIYINGIDMSVKMKEHP